MGLLTAPTCRIFLSVARSSVHCMDGSIIHRFLIICPWTTSLSSIHGQCPRMTLLSSKGDLVNYKSYSRSITFLSLLGWFLILSALLDMDDPYKRIRDELISRYPIKYKSMVKKVELLWSYTRCNLNPSHIIIVLQFNFTTMILSNHD